MGLPIQTTVCVYCGLPFKSAKDYTEVERDASKIDALTGSSLVYGSPVPMYLDCKKKFNPKKKKRILARSQKTLEKLRLLPELFE